MRIDVVTIFPDYLAPLALSLPGKAVGSGLLDLRVHDLRDFTHDRHRTVDDTPYGGGAGMVMRPEPWGEALDRLLADAPVPRLLVMTPSGRPFTQADAQRLSTEPRLAFACGRYEGIDARVVDWARGRMPVEEVSIGDYVLNGGEVAAMVCIEAIARLVPGFMGNPESIVEESHAGEEPMLEHPAYTKPPSWRGHDVPDVLFCGDHARIARWRAEQSRERTRERRPDLYLAVPAPAEPLPPVEPPSGMGFVLTPLAPGLDVQGYLAAWREAEDRVLASTAHRRHGWPAPVSDERDVELEARRSQVRHEAGVEHQWLLLRGGEVAGAVSLIGTTDGAELRWWTREEGDGPRLRRLLGPWAAGLDRVVRVPRR